MKNTLKINYEKNQIVMDREFAKKSRIVGSSEYNLLQNARKDYPNYKVVRHTIKKAPHKESYRGLTYKFMEDYISKHSNSLENMEEYKELRLKALCHSIRYPRIKKWFLEKYPNIDKFEISNENIEKKSLKTTKKAA